ncbi:hypothetical protein KUTeg_005930 [Tegillarca granosa]|uniref:Uncharacterized protein n=1 Tax=Tegillarca granosa TaxID=220873 RepID=A0ABQ9FGR1_TEGGR|nr:hypothetical protein KUTeg_005930 [Tegillarca granosa]
MNTLWFWMNRNVLDLISFLSIATNLTRLQSLDPKWLAIRKDRITKSVAGVIMKRKFGAFPYQL